MSGWKRCLAVLGIMALASISRGAWAGEPVGSAAAATGTIRAECARFHLTLFTNGAAREVVGEKGSASVAPGTYYVIHSDVEFTDKVGRTWKVRNGMAAAPIVVRAGETTQVTLGAPLEVRLSAHLEGGKVIAQTQCYGPMQDACEGVVVEGGSLPPPRVRILDGAGKVLAQPEGGYCCHFTGGVVWPLPAGVKGPLRVIPEIIFGPVPVWSEGAVTVDASGSG